MNLSAEDIERVARSLPEISETKTDRTWMLAIDECENNAAIAAISSLLIEAGLITGSTPLWNQRRAREDGSAFYTVGGAVPESPHDEDWGVPVEGVGWPDTAVVMWSVGLLRSHNVMLASRNSKLDNLGLRKLLHRHVAPFISWPYKLVLVLRGPNTDDSLFCREIVRLIARDECEYGFSEEKIVNSA